MKVEPCELQNLRMIPRTSQSGPEVDSKMVGDVKFKIVDDDDDTSDNSESNSCMLTVAWIQEYLSIFWKTHGTTIKYIIYALPVLGYAVYFGFAMSYEFGSESSIMLLWMTMLGVFTAILSVISDKWGDSINKNVIEPTTNYVKKHWMFFKW